MCTSCGEDPELVKKREMQRTEITQLQSEIALLDEKLKNVPKDESDDLKAAEKQLADLALEANKLETEVAGLQQRKANLEKELAQYKQKYPLN